MVKVLSFGFKKFKFQYQEQSDLDFATLYQIAPNLRLLTSKKGVNNENKTAFSNNINGYGKTIIIQHDPETLQYEDIDEQTHLHLREIMTYDAKKREEFVNFIKTEIPGATFIEKQ